MKIQSWPQTIRIIVFSCLIGGAAGVLGTALTTNYLSEYALQLGQVTQTLGISQTRPRSLPQSYDDALERLEERALPAVGSLFPDTRIGETGVSVFDSAVSIIVLTSDGWMLSPSGTLGDTVQVGAQTCEVDQVIIEPRFGYHFLHCVTSNSSVVDMVGGYGIAAGDQLFVVTQGREVVFTQAREIVWGEVVRSSDIPTRRILLTDDFTVREGSAVFNVYGEFVGVAHEGEGRMEIVPFEHLAGAFQQVLESVDTIVYPSLGIRGIDLSRTVGVSEEISKGRHTGFVIYGSRAIVPGSAAYKAGLQIGDMVVSVEGIMINATSSLDDLLTSYVAGQEMQIGIERDGAQQEVTVTLGELKL